MRAGPRGAATSRLGPRRGSREGPVQTRSIGILCPAIELSVFLYFVVLPSHFYILAALVSGLETGLYLTRSGGLR